MSRLQVDPFVFLFDRELKKLENEISLYSDEADLWKIEGVIANSAGNLCLHLCGNLQQYLGATLAKTSYVRNRTFEFSAKDLSKAQLLGEIQETRKAVMLTLEILDDASVQQTYPEQVLGYPMTTIFFLTHLYGHFGYHLGQINYHRRLISAPVCLK